MTNIQIFPENNVYILQAQPDTNFSAREYNNVLFTGRFTGVGTIYRSLLKFDLSQLAAVQSVKSAILRLYVGAVFAGNEPNNGPISQKIAIYPNTGTYDVKTVTWNNQPLSSGSIPIVDSKLTSIVTITQYSGFIDVPITNLVNAWLSSNPNSSLANNGVTIIGNEFQDELVKIASMYTTSSVNHPDGTPKKYWPQLLVEASGTIPDQPCNVKCTLEAGLGIDNSPLSDADKSLTIGSSETTFSSKAIQLGGNSNICFALKPTQMNVTKPVPNTNPSIPTTDAQNPVPEMPTTPAPKLMATLQLTNDTLTSNTDMTQVTWFNDVSTTFDSTSDLKVLETSAAAKYARILISGNPGDTVVINSVYTRSCGSQTPQ